MTKAQIPPTKIWQAVIHWWNAMENLAAVPKESFPREQRHVVAALRSMTSKTTPDWDAAFALIRYAIKAYSDIRGAPVGQYEYVADKTLSQFLKWELVRFLEENKPYRRLWKDKTRLREKSAEEIQADYRKRLARKYKTDAPQEIDALDYVSNHNAETCESCKCETKDLRCNHPKWPYITKEYMDDCFVSKDD